MERLASHPVEEKPDTTLPELTIGLTEERGILLLPGHLSKVLCKAGFIALVLRGLGTVGLERA